ncbi:hypothetical protein [Litorihabitans aurantiacus]|uniref:Flavin-dependent oxidoreductase, luciferase family (Includes alkanesulfonate monooxygenase SsuD and methylene tetrahydromethanopterin reductase) n=1 Tax=Litorihabitans aurantiacus TaxID=1930061 RepID=A0AA37XDS4_9MICO|nr:hypothetical protein [Litorihabitans aurantiacus]GMA30872.1 hypothetical protein GCM10025875_08640 [Litorihabitans aurantiacus]
MSQHSSNQHTSQPSQPDPNQPSRRHLHLGLDLTSLGAKASTFARPGAATGDRVDVAAVAEYVDLVRAAGVDLLTFGESFRLDDAPRPDAWLDPAVIASRLAAAGALADGPVVVPALPAGFLDPVRLARAVAGIHARSGGRAGWQLPISVTAGGVHAEVRRVWNGTPGAATGGRAPLIVTAPTEATTAVVAGRHSDVVRLTVSSPVEAARRRHAIRTAALEAGRNPDDVRVVVDAVTVIAQDAPSALFRADLIRDLAGASDRDQLTVAGTARGVADVFEDWFTQGAVDGFVIQPGSLPADVHALAAELAPELRERGLLGVAGSTTAEPAPAATSRPASPASR